MNNAKQGLAFAEYKAKELFNAAEERGFIVAGKTESQLSAEIVQLARDAFGIDEYWHKKIVRSGVNTLHPYSGNPPDRVIQEDDIVFLDFGPVFNGWEADLGRTYVTGNDPVKHQLKRDVEMAWHEAKSWYLKQDKLSGAAFFNYVVELAKRYGWEYAGEIAGHIVGPFPHEQLAPGDMGLDVHPDNHANILLPGKDGNNRHWILEMHFVDRTRGIGAFFEQLIM